MAYSKAKERVCISCGKTVPRPRCGRPRFFCSKVCKLTHRRSLWAKQHPVDTSPLQCKQCGKDFVPNPLVRYKAKYCSRRCKERGYYGRVVNFYKRHPHKKAQYHREQRKRKKWRGNWWKALQRDNFTCQLCGKASSETEIKRRSVVVHHFDGEGETGANNHQLGNLLTVCCDCHEGLHGISLVRIENKWYFKGKILKWFDTNSIGIWKEELTPL